MPRRLELSTGLPATIRQQDGVLTVRQAAMAGLTRGAVNHRLATGEWQRMLPGVLLTHDQPPTRRQLLYAARAWAGPDAVVDAECACHWHGLRAPTFDPAAVHLVVPYESPARSRDFVVVRRAKTIVTGGRSGLVDYVDAATAVTVAARRLADDRAITALASTALQQELVTVDDLEAAHVSGPPKGAVATGRVLDDLAVGVRSPAEADARRLVRSSRVLPEPLWNCWLDLGDGGPPVSPDGLWIDAAMIHETNGRRYHAWATAFDDLQARHDRLTAAGFIVLHNTPWQLRREGAAALRAMERTYLRYAGRGLPDGVTILRRSASGSPASARAAG